MKRRHCPTSNELFNVPMTEEQWDVVDFIGFEAETAFVYPFAVDFDDVTMDMVDSIVAGCQGHTNDTDVLYGECERVLGVNPDLKKGREVPLSVSLKQQAHMEPDDDLISRKALLEGLGSIPEGHISDYDAGRWDVRRNILEAPAVES